MLWGERRLYDKRRHRRDQAFANIAADLARRAREYNIGIVFVGYPRYILRNKPCKEDTNMRSQYQLLLRLATTFENNGGAAFAVSEDNTSRECAYYGCEVVRKPMGAGHMPPWAHIAQRRERCPEHHAARAGGAGHKGRVARAHHCGELHSNSVEDDTHNSFEKTG